MRFPARILKVGGSLGITIPIELVEKFKLMKGQIMEFELIEMKN
jgi:antitoxin component of MazEF toxin-antitoxin module